MNSIKFLEGFKVKRERQSSEYTEACIRDLIQANPDKILRADDFAEATGLNKATVSTKVRKLVAAGKIKRFRRKDGRQGVKYVYRWVNGGVVPTVQHSSPGAVKVTAATGYATDYELKRLDSWFLDFCSSRPVVDVVGASEFRNFVRRKVEAEDA